MTEARTVMGWVFVAIMIISVIYAAVSPSLQPIVLPKVQLPWLAQTTGATDYYNLVKDTNVSQGINYVHLNATVKVGVISVSFSDNPSLAVGARFDRGQNASALKTGQTTEDQILNVNMYGETGTLNLTLGRSLQYNGNFNIRIGVFTIRLDQHANVSKVEAKIEYIGGMVVGVHDGASFEQLDLAVDLGGVALNIDADHIIKDASIDMTTSIGGVSMGINVNTNQVGVSLEGTVDMGGIITNNDLFSGTTTNTHCSLRTSDYQSAGKKINIEANIGLGGITLQPITQYMPGFTV